MHRAVWESVHGAVPSSVDVHHIDHDPGNNDINNLRALSRSEHLREHGPRGFIAWTTGQHRDRASAMWDRRAPACVKCHHCGAAFDSTGMRSKFCGKNCATAQWRAEHPKPRKGREHLRRAPKQCAQCGVLFKANDPRAPTCSRACGVAYKSARRRASQAS